MVAPDFIEQEAEQLAKEKQDKLLQMCLLEILLLYLCRIPLK